MGGTSTISDLCLKVEQFGSSEGKIQFFKSEFWSMISILSAHKPLAPLIALFNSQDEFDGDLQAISTVCGAFVICDM